MPWIAKLWCARSALGALILLLGVAGGDAGAREETFAAGSFRIGYRDVSADEVERFAATAENARAAIVAFLGRRNAGPISVSIGDVYKFPRWDQRGQRIVMPANRLQGNANGPPRFRGRGTAIISIMTRVIAPSRHRDWGKFLETGLGVYLQERFEDDEDRSFPTMGRDLHETTAIFARDFGRFIPLARVESERTATTRFRRARTLGFLEEGSFVRFLIETRGLKRFLEFYDGASCRQVYGVEFADLEDEWRRMILSLKVSGGE